VDGVNGSDDGKSWDSLNSSVTSKIDEIVNNDEGGNCFEKLNEIDRPNDEDGVNVAVESKLPDGVKVPD
jgi:hypothetical protein